MGAVQVDRVSIENEGGVLEIPIFPSPPRRNFSINPYSMQALKFKLVYSEEIAITLLQPSFGETIVKRYAWRSNRTKMCLSVKSVC